MYIRDEMIQITCHLGIHIYTWAAKEQLKRCWSADVLPAYYLLSVLWPTVTFVKHSFGSLQLQASQFVLSSVFSSLCGWICGAMKCASDASGASKLQC